MPERRPQQSGDELMDQLAALPVRDVDALRAATLRAQGHRALAAQSQSDGPLAMLQQLYRRALEPALVAALSVGYLWWAFATAMSLH